MTSRGEGEGERGACSGEFLRGAKQDACKNHRTGKTGEL